MCLGVVQGGEVGVEHHYYAFGLEMRGSWNDASQSQSATDDNRYRYNGKELNEELGLYDYGARWYDPAIAKWGQVDPLASDMPGWSPYNYVFNNPIAYIDPFGLSPYTYNWTTEQYEDEDGNHVDWQTVQGSIQQNATLDVLLYNDPNAGTGLTTRNLTSFVNGVSSTMSLNGISDNVNYTLLDDLDGVPQTAFDSDRTLFLALTNGSFGSAEGASRVNNTGSGISFYSVGATGKIYFNSGLDVDKFRIGQGSHLTDPAFRGWWKSEISHLAYAGAHELLHQLDVHSRNAIPGNMSSYPSDGHYDGSINILNAGGAYGQRNQPGVGNSYRMLPEGVRRRILEYLNNR